MGDDEKVSKEVLELHMKHVRESLHDIRDGFSSFALISKTVTEHAIILIEIEKDKVIDRAKTEKNEKNIIELNTHKKYLSFIGITIAGLMITWIKTKM